MRNARQQIPYEWPVLATSAFVVERLVKSKELRFTFASTKIPRRVVVRWRSLGRDRLPLGSMGYELHAVSLSKVVPFKKLVLDRALDDEVVWRRIEIALRGVPLHVATCHWPLPPSHSEVAYCGLSIDAWSSRPEGGSVGPSNGSPVLERFEIERRKCDLGLGTGGNAIHYGFLLNRKQFHTRLEEISRWAVRKRIFTSPADEISTGAMVKLMFNLLGGYDTPLMARNWEGDACVD